MTRRPATLARAIGVDHAPRVPADVARAKLEREVARLVAEHGHTPGTARDVAEANQRHRTTRQSTARTPAVHDPLGVSGHRSHQRPSRRIQGPTVAPGDTHPDDDPETREHVRLVAVLVEAGLVFQHSPNGERRTREGAGRLRRMGTSPGFPDLIVLTPPPARPGCPGVALELKAPERRPARPVSPPWAPSCFSAAQRDWLERLESLGWVSLVAYEAEEAVQQLAALGYPVRAAVERLRARRSPGWA